MVRHGAWNSDPLFLPAIPPNKSNGDAPNSHIENNNKVVHSGRAAFTLYVMATVFKKQNVRKSGPPKTHPVSSMFLTCHNKRLNFCNESTRLAFTE